MAVNYVVLGLVAVVALTPILWGVSTSLKENRQIFTVPPVLIPDPVTFEHYIGSFEGGMSRAFGNSLIVSLVSTALSLTIGSLGAYGLVHLPWKARDAVTLLIIAPMMIPGLANLVPLYVLMSRLGLVDTLAGLVVLSLVGNLSTTVWIMRGFFETVPQALEDAAIVDGCGQMGVLYRVILPISQPGLAAAGVYCFLGAWNSFLMPSVMISSRPKWTVPLVVHAHIGDYSIDWGGLMASSMIAVIPIVLVFLFLQRRFISGLSRGAVKG
jgi:ABC-type glycerol-3-phosphate transport system permease component